MTEHIEGLIPAPYTPMNSDGSVNIDAIDEQAQLLQRNGCQGVFICGTTGEGMSLTVQERMDVARRWMDVVDGDFRVIVHVGHTSLEVCKRLAGHTVEIAAWGIGAMGPFFYKPESVGDLVAFCAEVAAVAPERPFYYYHIPSMTGIDFPMADFLRAALPHIPNLTGVKFTSEDLMDYKRCRELEDGRFDMLFGRDEILISALAMGARGAVGSTYNFAAPLYLKLIEAFRMGDLEKARALQDKSIAIVNLLIHAPCGFMAAGKAVMKMIGVDCGPTRLPLRKIAPDQYNDLRAQLEKIDFFDYCSE